MPTMQSIITHKPENVANKLLSGEFLGKVTELFKSLYDFRRIHGLTYAKQTNSLVKIQVWMDKILAYLPNWPSKATSPSGLIFCVDERGGGGPDGVGFPGSRRFACARHVSISP